MSQPQWQQPPSMYTRTGQEMTASEERTWGMAAHVVALAAMALSAGLLGFLGSLVIYLMYRDRGPFVRQHAANSLNVQITTGIIVLVSIPLMFVLVGFVTFAYAMVFALVVHIVGAVKATNGQWYDPPLTWRFVR